MSPKLVIVGYCNNDVNRYPDGTERRLPGGAAYFGSLAASLLCGEVGLVTRLGSDFSAAGLLQRFPSKGLHFSETPCSCSVQSYLDPNDPTKREVVLLDGASQEFKPGDIPQDWVTAASIVHVATMPPWIQSGFLRAILDIRGSQQRPLISVDTEQSFLLDAAQLRIVKDMLPLADLVFLNRIEAQLLSEVVPCLRSAVLKKDAEGAEVHSYGSLVASSGTRDVEVLDATGAGDVFAGIFLAGLVEGKPLEECLELACEMATRSVECEGILHLLEGSIEHLP